jgi:hypothetical protein
MILDAFKYIISKKFVPYASKTLPYSLIAFILIIKLNTTAALAQEATTEKGLIINSHPPGATVYIESEVIGKTPCTFPYNLTGKYKFWAEKKGYDRKSRTYEFPRESNKPILFDLSPKNRTKAVLRSFVIPGWGQNYTEQKWKSRIFFSLQIASLVSLGLSHLNYEDKLDKYRSQLANYKTASKSFMQEAPAWEKMVDAHSKLERIDKARQVLLISSAAIYGANLLDAIFNFPRDLRQIEIVGSPISNNNNSQLGIKLSFVF